jgi:outer membrane protein assembly factor BamB
VPGVPGALVYGQGRVWVWNYSSTILPVDADTGVAAAYIPMGADLSAIAVGSTAVWATQPTKNVVVRLDLASATLINPPIAVGARPDSIAVGDGKVYVLNKADRTITTLDEATGNTLGAPVSVPDGTTQVTVESGHVFIGGSKGFALLPAGPSGLQGVDQSQLVDLNCSCGFFGGRESTWVFDDDTGTLRRFSLDLRTELGAPLTGFGNGIAGVVAVGDKLWILNQVQAKLYPVAVNGPI